MGGNTGKFVRKFAGEIDIVLDEAWNSLRRNIHRSENNN